MALNNLDGQLLYDLTLKNSFQVLETDDKGPVISSLSETVGYYFPSWKSALPPKNVIPAFFTAFSIGSSDYKVVIIVTRTEGLVYSEENQFEEPIWKFDLLLDREPNKDSNFFLVPVGSTSLFLLVDGQYFDCYLLDISSKTCSNHLLHFTLNSPLVGVWNLPERYAQENTVLALTSFGQWEVLSISSQSSLKSGTLNCPSLITSAIFIPEFWLLVIGYTPKQNLNSLNKDDSGRSVCFSSFRLATESPYMISDTEVEPVSSTSGFWKHLAFFRNQRPNAPLKMFASPSNRSLLVSHESGAISFWSLPSLKFIDVYKKESQRTFNEPTNDNLPVDEGAALSQCIWWSDDAVAMVFEDGAYSVCSVENLNCLTGSEPEWFEPLSLISVIPEETAFILQRQPKQEAEQNEHDISNQSRALVQRASPLSIAYWMKKIMALVNPSAYEEPASPGMDEPSFCTLELWSFQKVTPEQLFEIKLENEEYGDALILAQAYKFDTDLIHLRRWNKEPVSRVSIEDFLAKVANKRTAINETIKRVAESLDGQRDLLEFGMKLTCPNNLFEDDENFGDNTDDDDFLQKFVEEASSKVIDTMASLKPNQADILLLHFKILDYLKRLELYEALLVKNTTISYESEVFAQIRDRDIFELAVDAARSGEVTFVELIVSYYCTRLQPFLLAIVSNFPETLSPTDYQHLIPVPGVSLIIRKFNVVN